MHVGHSAILNHSIRRIQIVEILAFITENTHVFVDSVVVSSLGCVSSTGVTLAGPNFVTTKQKQTEVGNQCVNTISTNCIKVIKQPYNIPKLYDITIQNYYQHVTYILVFLSSKRS